MSGQFFANVMWACGDQAGLRFQSPFDLSCLALSRPQLLPENWKSPTFLEATISSTAITATDRASGINAFGSYTTDLMMLTWVHKECIVYCTGEVTRSNELKMVRQ